MTWDQIESNWKQLKGDLQGASERRRPMEAAAASNPVESEIVSYKRSLHHGTAFIRRRNPAQVEQAGWTAAR